MRQCQTTEDYDEAVPAGGAPRQGAEADHNETGLELLVRRFARLNLQAAALAARLPVKGKG